MACSISPRENPHSGASRIRRSVRSVRRPSMQHASDRSMGRRVVWRARPAGGRVRGHFKLLAYEPLPGGAQLTVQVTIELEGSPKPACVAETVSRRYT